MSDPETDLRNQIEVQWRACRIHPLQTHPQLAVCRYDAHPLVWTYLTRPGQRELTCADCSWKGSPGDAHWRCVQGEDSLP